MDKLKVDAEGADGHLIAGDEQKRIETLPGSHHLLRRNGRGQLRWQDVESDVNGQWWNRSQGSQQQFLIKRHLLPIGLIDVVSGS